MYKKYFINLEGPQTLLLPENDYLGVKYIRFNKKNKILLRALFKNDAHCDGKIWFFIYHNHAICPKKCLLEVAHFRHHIVCPAPKIKNPRCALERDEFAVEFISGNYTVWWGLRRDGVDFIWYHVIYIRFTTSWNTISSNNHSPNEIRKRKKDKEKCTPGVRLKWSFLFDS